MNSYINIVMKRLMIFLLTLIAWIYCEAETIHWVVPPKYQSMSVYGDRMVKVREKSGKVSIFNCDGIALAENADTIVPPAEGYGLVLKYVDVKTTFYSFQAYQLMNIFDSEYSTDVSNKGLYVNLYPFFSEGKLPVFDKSKKYGYIDSYGEWVIKPQYSYVQPFCEGFAVVGQASAMNVARKALNSLQTLNFVDSHGMELETPSVPGSIVEASSFKKGESCVRTEGDIEYYINTSGSVLSTKARTLHSYDDKHRLLNEQGQPKKVAFDVSLLTDNITIQATLDSEKQLYGLMTPNGEIAPPQFLEMNIINNEYVIARTKDGYGLLKVEIGIFEANNEIPLSDETLGAGREKVEYQFVIPECWRDKELWMCYSTSNEKDCAYAEGNGEKTRSFVQDLPITDRVISISSDGITLWERHETDYSILRNRSGIDKINLSLNSSSVRASGGGRGTCTAVITNNSNNNRSLTVELSGVGVSFRKEYNLSPGGQENVIIPISKIIRKEERIITVTITDNTTGVEKNINDTIIVLPYSAK